jgi:hypothetical protein
MVIVGPNIAETATSYTANALCPAHLIGIVAPCKRMPKLAYVGREGTTRRRAQALSFIPRRRQHLGSRQAEKRREL